jgi:hypothetical protein
MKERKKKLHSNYSPHTINSEEWKINAINVVSYEVAMFLFWGRNIQYNKKWEFIRINTASEQQSSVAAG